MVAHPHAAGSIAEGVAVCALNRLSGQPIPLLLHSEANSEEEDEDREEKENHTLVSADARTIYDFGDRNKILPTPHAKRNLRLIISRTGCIFRLWKRNPTDRERLNYFEYTITENNESIYAEPGYLEFLSKNNLRQSSLDSILTDLEEMFKDAGLTFGTIFSFLQVSNM